MPKKDQFVSETDIQNENVHATLLASIEDALRNEPGAAHAFATLMWLVGDAARKGRRRVALITKIVNASISAAYEHTSDHRDNHRAGLAVNLGDQREQEAQPLRAAVIAAAAPAQNAETKPAPNAPPSAPPVSEPTEDKQEEKEKVEAGRTGEALKKAPRDAMADPKSFKRWSNESHGLSVSTKARELDEQTRVALVAVKNVGDVPLQILPGHPDLVVETVNEKGKIIQLENVKKRLQEASAKSNVIPARSTVYYAVAFNPPILGKRQKLRVTVGQRNAADDPAGVNLNASAK